MDLIKLLRSVEELIYEVALWVLLYPRTLAQALFFPSWIQPYVAGEWLRDERDRFDGFLSPPLVLAVSVMIPFVIFLDSMQPMRARPSASDGQTLRTTLSSPQNLYVYYLIGTVTAPLGFAWALTSERRQRISRVTLKRHFYAQCLIASPMALLVWLFFFSIPAARAWEGSAIGIVFRMFSFGLGYFAIAWFWYAQWRFLRQERGSSAWRSILSIGSGMGMWGLLNVMLTAPLWANMLLRR